MCIRDSYEISNYAQADHRSVHNQAYWLGADYLGLGPSAFSTHKRIRWKNAPDTADYIRLLGEGRVPIVESEELDDRKWLFERVALELRTAEGLPLSRVDASLSPNVDTLLQEQLAVIKEDRLILTRSGKPLLDSIAEMLLTDQ